MTVPLVLAARLLLGQANPGYVREQTDDGAHCLRWPVAAGATTQITFVQSATGDSKMGAGLFDAVSRSEATWAAQASSCSSLVLSEGSRSSSRLIGYASGAANENLILVRTTDCATIVLSGDPCHSSDTCGNVYDCWDQPAGVLALTITTFDSTGVVVDTDVEINGATAAPSVVDSPSCTGGNVPPSCVGNDVQNTVTHELGHALGLGHSPDPSSTMFASAPLGETSKRVLDPVTKQFVCDVYPRGLASRDCSLPDGGTDPGTGGGTGGGGGGGSGSLPPGGAPGIVRNTSGCATVAGGGAPGALLGALSLGALALRRRPRTRR